MANISKSLLDAISVIANKTADEVASDKTIKAIVKKIVSTSEGKYLVSYNSGDFYAYIQSGTDLYQIGEQVYILVPEGDMTQKKFILGRVDEEQKSTKILQSSLLNDYVTIGGNAVIENTYSPVNQAYVKRMQPLALNSHHINDYYYCYLRDPDSVKDLPKKNNKYIYNTIEYPSVSIDEETFKNSAKEAQALLIRAKFKALLDTKFVGNYGIIINIAFADETNPQTDEDGNVTYPPKLIAYTLDTSKMTGNPMKFYDYISQYTIANFDGMNYLYIDSIVAFSEGFVESSTLKHDNDDDVYIYIDDIEIVGLNEISAVNGDYKLKLTTPKGNTVKAGKKNKIEVIATITYLNKDITDNTTFYWGVKDPSITSASEQYNAKLGSGYRKLDNSTGTLTLSSADLTAAENSFICIAIYESELILKAPVTLYNNNNKIDITITSDQGTSFQFNEGNPVLTCMINGKTSNYQENYPDEAFSFIWSKEDPELGTVLLNETEAQLEESKAQELQECRDSNDGVNSQGRTTIQVLSYYATKVSQVKNISYLNGTRGPAIKCQVKSINSFVTYSCSVYRGGVYVGYGSITLQNSQSVVNDNYYITITNGSQVFQYNESGVAPNSERLAHPIEVLNLTAVFHNPQGAEVTPKQVRWIVPSGNTLIDIPSLGLENDSRTNERYYTGDVYPLSIKDTYDNTCVNNQIIAVVTHSDGTEYRQSTDLLFTKIGDIGTNGTDTVVKITELINLPKDERLTVVKPFRGEATYNGRESCEKAALSADLYTNNTRVAGYNNKWLIAGMPESESSKCYTVDPDDNACVLTYDFHSGDNLLDTRIVKVKTTLEGKYFYNFYGIPTIEYYENYDYQNYPIKVMREGTLNNVLYDSNGSNPVFNEAQGVHVELDNWQETGYLEWKVESGLKRDGEYNYPNFSLSKSPKAKTGSMELKTSYDIEDIQSHIYSVQDIGAICSTQATPAISQYIDKFIADIEQTIIDDVLSSKKKIKSLWNRLATFSSESPDKENIYIKTVYEEYQKIIDKMEKEYEARQELNKVSADIQEQVNTIWNSEWPNVITASRLHSVNPAITSFEALKNKYQRTYDQRAQNANQVPSRSTIFDSTFIELLQDGDNNLDKYYNDYWSSLGSTAEWAHPVLIEYSKVLIGYLKLLVDETTACFESEHFYKDEDGNSTDLVKAIKKLYNIAFNDWSTETLKDNNGIGKNIYEAAVSANEIAASVYENVRDLYSYYKALFLGVKKHQVSEDSKTLNAWQAIAKGKKPNLLNQIYVVPNNTFNGMYMNNNVVGTAFVKNNGRKQNIAKIYVPIIMTLNTYELASLNGWDGTSIDINDGGYIMTPQIGAGIKDSTTNTFTGMVMGVIGNNNVDNKDTLVDKKNATNRTGLAGYYNGVQSVFIDSKTGSAYFGLPEQDKDSEDGANEGRIELVPGGVSKIGNWKIGNRFLYNIIDGNYETRKDLDARSDKGANKKLVPHDRHGIILSADQPYIHIKGEVYENDNLKGINYQDEYNDINPGDSLELRLDPGNKSLFSIIQHTIGFGDEEDDTLRFGYTTNRNSSIIKVKDYTANKKNSDENTDDTDYYIYAILTKPSTDESLEPEPVPYYRALNDDDQNNGFTINKIGNWDFPSVTIYEENIQLKDVLLEDKFQKTSVNPVFKLSKTTGMIRYAPQNLEWVNGVVGSTNTEGWASDTGGFSFIEPQIIQFSYNKWVHDPIDKEDIKIGSFRNNTGYDIYEIDFHYQMEYILSNISLNASDNNYIQFYVVSNENDSIDNALLQSEKMQIQIDSDSKDISVQLLSNNLNKILKNTTYYLKMAVFIDNYVINANCKYRVAAVPTSYKAPALPKYGAVEIAASTGGVQEFVSNPLTGTYEIDSSKRLRFKVKTRGTYDFIVWRKGDTAISAGGRTVKDGYAKFFTTQGTTWDDSNDYFVLNPAPSGSNIWYISFYPEGTYTTVTTTYVQNSTAGSIVEEEETTEESVDITTTEVEIYKINSNIPMNNTENVYAIQWGQSANDYQSLAASWGIKLTNFKFDSILGLIPDDITALCVEDSAGSYWKGTPYVKTTIDAQNEQIVTFYSNYYQRVIEQHADQADSKGQYGYIKIAKSGSDIYKYIKTLTAATVHNWFRSVTLPEGVTGGDLRYGIRDWVEAKSTSSAFKDASYWKEVIRVGLDENGRLFSSGLQDQRTYSRTGRLNSFGGAIRFYGQEIRVQKNKSTAGDYVPILKIFADSSEKKTTYITQGAEDTGNISLRTAGNGCIELGASQTHQIIQNKDNTDSSLLAPKTTSSIRVTHKDGVQLQANTSPDKDGTVTIVNSLNLSTNGLRVNSNESTILVGDAKIGDSDATFYDIRDQYIWTKATKQVFASCPSNSPESAYSNKPYVENKNSEDDSISSINHYKVIMTQDIIKGDKTETDALISLQVGQNSALKILKDEISMSNGSYSINICNKEAQNKLLLSNASLRLELQEHSISLRHKDKTSEISIIQNEDKAHYSSVKLVSNCGGAINIDNTITISGGGLVVNENATFEKSLGISNNTYIMQNLHVGRDMADKTNTKESSIYLYTGEDDNQYVRLLGKELRMLLDWYNQKRWAIGWNGNTVWLRNVGSSSNPEGSYKNNRYSWDIKKFSGYKK